MSTLYSIKEGKCHFAPPLPVALVSELLLCLESDGTHVNGISGYLVQYPTYNFHKDQRGSGFSYSYHYTFLEIGQ